MTMDELIAKLEAAQAGSLALDREIWEAVAGEHASRLDLPPAYSVSLDAAVALVPEGAEYTISTLYGVADVELPLNFIGREPERVRRKDGNVILALCIAALKARVQREIADG